MSKRSLNQNIQLNRVEHEPSIYKMTQKIIHRVEDEKNKKKEFKTPV